MNIQPGDVIQYDWNNVALVIAVEETYTTPGGTAYAWQVLLTGRCGVYPRYLEDVSTVWRPPAKEQT